MAIVFPECNSLIKIDHNGAILDGDPDRKSFQLELEKLKINWSEEHLPDHAEIVIIGGGLIGCGVACQLRKALPKAKIIIIDPNQKLLQRYVDRTSAIDQKIMRSPYDHQIAPDGDLQLIDYAKLYYENLTLEEREQVRNATAGQRGIVPLDLFLFHSTAVVHNYGLCNLAYTAEVITIAETDSAVLNIHTKNKIIKANQVIVANGLSERTNLLGYKYDDQVYSCYVKDKVNSGQKIAVVGSGLSAGHVIFKLVKKGVIPTWIVRHEEEIYRCTDVTSMYFREEGVSLFQQSTEYEKKQILAKENRGSLMIEYLELFNLLESEGKLVVKRNFDVQSVERIQNQIVLKSSSKELCFDQVIDSCGLRPQFKFLQNSDLYDNGYPILKENGLSLKSTSNLYFVGASASMQLGPGAKNVEGIRLAVELLIQDFSRKSKPYQFVNYINGNTKIG